MSGLQDNQWQMPEEKDLEVTSSAAPTSAVDHSGARESNAGDDFHFLWAVRTVLQLLSPNTDLLGVTIEGVTREDGSALAQDDLLLGVDLGQYYGGRSFEQARRVVHSQLKYSTRHPGKSWTTARLCANSKERKNDSVIRRLATIASFYQQRWGAEAVMAKLSIQLVSNQAAAPELLSALKEAQDCISDHSVTLAGKLIPLLSTPNRTQIETLQAAAAVASRDFIVFLSALDLSGCGASTRALLRVETLKQIGLSSLLPGEDLRLLYELVKELAGPGQDGYLITREDVLAALQLGTDNSLFPAPAKIECPQPTLPTEDAARVADFILQNRGRQVIVHGPAGIGKTTTLTQLAVRLPEGSEVFQYDCYGGGDYLDLGQERHRAEDCFVQLANEFAVRLGAPLFLHRVTDPFDAGHMLVNRLKKASELIGPNGLLVIILDAADNSVTAARQSNSSCFVPDLRRLRLPDNCCVVYSVRTHRIGLVDDAASLSHILLEGFTPEATALLVRTYIPGASETVCAEVHRLSQGVPRFASYLLSQVQPAPGAEDAGADDLRARLRALAPRALEDVFEGIVTNADRALADARDQGSAEGVLPPLLQDAADKRSLVSLVLLARPLAVDDYATFAELSVERAERFCRALHPGLVFVGRTLRFRDEDFETYLRSKFSDTERDAVRRDLSDRLLARRRDNSYAATHAADYLIAAGRWAEAIRLATDEPEPEVIPDEVSRLYVRMKRLACGLSACAATRDFPTAARLLLEVAEAKRTSESVLELVREHPDLAALYGDVERLGTLYMREHEGALRSERDQGGKSWLGAAHMRVAAMYARRPDFRDLANDHLRAAEAWLRIRNGLSEQERHRWDVKDEDVASGATAVFHIAGAEAAARYITRWRPIEVVRRATRLAVRQLRECLDDAASAAFLSDAEKGMPRRLRTWGAAYLASCLWLEGVRVPAATLDRIAGRLDRAISRGPLPNFEPSVFNVSGWTSTGWRATLLEALVIEKLPSERTMRLLDALAPPRPQHAPSGRDTSAWEATLRFELLRARLQGRRLELDDLMPHHWKEQLADREQRRGGGLDAPAAGAPNVGALKMHEDDLERFRASLGKLLPAYDLWAETVVQQPSLAEIEERVRAAVAASGDYSKYEADALSFRSRCEIAWRAVCNCSDLEGDGRARANELLELMSTNAERSAKVGTVDAWLRFAAEAVPVKAVRNTALEILERAGAYVDGQAMPARERWDVLMRCARIALPHSPELCQDFYRRGLEAADDVDDESLPLIRSLSSLARSLAGSGTAERRQQLAASLRSVAEEYRLRFSQESSTPWDEVLQAVSALDARVGLSACYHWDRLNVRTIDLSLPTVLAEAVRSRQLDPVPAVALLTLSRGDWEDRVERYGPDTRFGAAVAYREALLNLHQQGQPRANALQAVLGEVSERLRRDFGLADRKRIVPQFVQWADSVGISGPALETLREVATFCRSLPEVKDYSSDPEWDAKWENEVAARRTRLNVLLAAAGRGGLGDLSERLAEARSLDYENGVAAYIRALAESLPHSSRPDLVRGLLVDFSESSESQDGDYVRLARELVDKWKTNGLVARAADEAVRQLVRQRLRKVAPYFGELQLLARIPPEELFRDYLFSVAGDMANWGSQPLFAAFQHIGEALPDEQRWPVVEMGARHLLDKVETPVPPVPPVAADVTQAVAGLLFALCGHEDAHLRWDVLHAGRFLCRMTPNILLPAFVQTTTATEAPMGFSHTGGRNDAFRWMTARVYALLLLERVTDEAPAAMLRHREVLRQHLSDDGFPHAQVRELARRALLRLAETYPDVVHAELREEIEGSNRPRGCLHPRRPKYSMTPDWVAWKRGGDTVGPHAVFHFDSMDVIPYWFDPACEVFHLDRASFLSAAEGWVAGRWGIGEEDARSDWGTLQNRYPSGTWDNRHGTLPRVETAPDYFSYHAMQCVMGQLVEDLPVSVNPEDDEDEPAGCPWQEWLSRFLPGPEGWLADLRGSVPLETELWWSPNDVKQWIDVKDEASFNRVRFPDHDQCAGWTVAYASVSYMSDAIRGSAHLVSALVIPGKAASLLRALESAGPRNWQLPIRGWSHGEWEVHEDGFRLEAWLTDRWQREAFDHLDPRAKDLPSETRLELGAEVCGAIGLTRARNGREWHDADGALVGRMEYWSDNPQTERNYSFFTFGRRLWIRTDVVLRFLKRAGLDLIVSTVLDRNYSYDYTRYRDIERKEDGDHVRVHLLRADGRVEAMARGGAAGTAHPEGIGTCQLQPDVVAVDGPPHRRAPGAG